MDEQFSEDADKSIILSRYLYLCGHLYMYFNSKTCLKYSRVAYRQYFFHAFLECTVLAFQTSKIIIDTCNLFNYH